MRQPAARAAAQIVDGRIVPVKLGVARIGVLADIRFCLWRGSLRCGSLGCGYGRRIVHGRFLLAASIAPLSEMAVCRLRKAERRAGEHEAGALAADDAANLGHSN